MYYKNLKINGTEYPLAVNLSGEGAPTADIEAEVGMFYMDKTNGDVYKLTPGGWVLTEDLAQTTGYSETKAMSQKATTEALGNKADNTDVVALRKAVNALESGKENKVDANAVRERVGTLEQTSEVFEKRLTNVEASLSDDMFITDSTSAYEKAVPANVAPYAAVDKIGGMTYKSKNLFNPADIEVIEYHSVTFTVDEDGTMHLKGNVSPDDFWGVSLQVPFALVGNYCVTFYGSGANYCNIAGAPELDLNPSEGHGYPFTSDGTGSLHIDFYQTYNTEVITDIDLTCKIMINEGDTALPWEPYFEGLRHTPVTKLESIGKNLLDISKGVNENFKDNGDGTYTITKTSSGRFSKKIPIFIPANTEARIYGKILSYSNSTYNFAQLQFFKANGNSDYTLPMREVSTKILSTDSDIVGATIYLDYNNAVGDYVTFSEPQIELGATATDYAPYSAEPIDKFEIPPEVIQDLKGYGEGISEECNNHIAFNDDGTVHYRKELFDFVVNSNRVLYVATQTDQSTYRYFFGAAKNTELVDAKLVGIVDTAKYSLCTKLPRTTPATDAVGYYVTTASTGLAIYVKSPYESATKTLEWLDGTVFKLALAKPEITDITDLMPSDNFFKVQSNGRIRAVNKHALAAPTTITYQKEG